MIFYHRRMFWPGGKEKALTFSYDDDVIEDVRLKEIFDAHGLKCTFNLNMGYWRTDADKPTTRRMYLSDAQKLFADGKHEIAVHGLTHIPLRSVPKNMAAYDVAEDIHRAEEAFGCIVRGMAYPNNSFSADTPSVLDACGIAYCRTTRSTRRFDLPENWLLLDPTCHHDDPDLFTLADRFLSGTPYGDGWMFYVWGHAYEFDDHDNWGRIETFAEKVGGRDDVWYATNIGIYDYVQAYRRLIFSSDGTRCFNPSAQEVFFSVGDWGKEKLYSVLPGQTITVNR